MLIISLTSFAHQSEKNSFLKRAAKIQSFFNTKQAFFCFFSNNLSPF